ncbi:MAG: lipase family alpha/beta hydrolase [Phycisphaerales bacterium]|jgi:hypothetical protein
MPELTRYTGRILERRTCMVAPVARDGRQRLSRDSYPVVLVPGIMGSRIELEDGSDRIWDPDRTRFMAWLMTQSPDFRSRYFNHRLTPGRTMRVIYEEDNRQAPEGSMEARIPQTRTDRNWASVSWEYYGAGMAGIQADIAADGGVLWCFGYDWRKSNLHNGRLLKEFIRDTVAPTSSLPPIIVTHSMGGLVTRAACAAHGMEDMIAGVVHTMMPTYGAAEAYGSQLHGTMGMPFRFLIGSTRLEINCVSSGVTGMYQLMPSSRYPHAWASYDSQLFNHTIPNTPYSLSRPYEIYRESTGLIGIVDHSTFEANVVNVGANTYVNNTRRMLQHILDNIAEAERYHETVVRDYCHPCTWLIAGTDQATVIDSSVHYHRDTVYGVELDPYSSCDLNTGSAGDATVPLSSARILESHANCRGGYIVSGIEHAQSTNARVVIQGIGDLIRRIRDERYP